MDRMVTLQQHKVNNQPTFARFIAISSERVEFKLCSSIYECLHNSVPRYLSEYCIPVATLSGRLFPSEIGDFWWSVCASYFHQDQDFSHWSNCTEQCSFKYEGPRESWRDLHNRRLYEHGICIGRHCQDSELATCSDPSARRFHYATVTDKYEGPKYHFSGVLKTTEILNCWILNFSNFAIIERSCVHL